MYHSHSSGEKIDGLFGGLFVHKAPILKPSTSLLVQDNWDKQDLHAGGAGFMQSSLYLGGTGEITTDPFDTRFINSDGIELGSVAPEKILINGGTENGRTPQKSNFTIMINWNTI